MKKIFGKFNKDNFKGFLIGFSIAIITIAFLEIYINITNTSHLFSDILGTYAKFFILVVVLFLLLKYIELWGGLVQRHEQRKKNKIEI